MCGRSRPEGTVLVALGELREALGWANENGLSGRMTSALPARVRSSKSLARGSGPELRGRAEEEHSSRRDPALGAPPASSRGGAGQGSVIEILVCGRAGAHQARDESRALASLQRRCRWLSRKATSGIFADFLFFEGSAGLMTQMAAKQGAAPVLCQSAPGRREQTGEARPRLRGLLMSNEAPARDDVLRL